MQLCMYIAIPSALMTAIFRIQVYNLDHSYPSYNIVRIIVTCIIADLCNKVTADNSHNIIPIGKTSKLTER